MAAHKSEQDAKEIELKLAFDPDDAARLLSHPVFARDTAPKTRELISTYYDTPDDTLRQAGVFLRVRATGDGYVQTIKAARDEAEFFERAEWEKPLCCHEPDLDAAKGTALEPLLTPEVRAALGPRFHTRFRRKTYRVARDGADIELALDQGEITAGLKAAPISELELELKLGDKRALFGLARELAKTLPLHLAVKSKAERGFELLDDGDFTVEKARPVEVTPEMTNADAFRAVAQNCLRQIMVNAPAVHEARPEALHQTRVGLRRLRAALALFDDVVDDDDHDDIRAELKWITGELGPARDLDVFASEVLGPLRAAHPDDADLADVHRDVVRQRATAYTRATVAAASARFRLLLIDLTAWIETGAWADGKRARGPVVEFATGQLDRLRRKLKKSGEDLRKLSAPKRHKVRIKAKRLRYATEFFAATFPGKKSAKRHDQSLDALEDLQDELGILNDIATHRALTATGQGDGVLRLQAADGDGEASHLKAAQDAYDRFVEAKPFWTA